MRFTARRRTAWTKIHEILAGIDAEWRTIPGESEFRRLKALLCKVWLSDLVP